MSFTNGMRFALLKAWRNNLLGSSLIAPILRFGLLVRASAGLFPQKICPPAGSPKLFCLPAQAIKRRPTTELIRESIERYGRMDELGQRQILMIAPEIIQRLNKVFNPLASARLFLTFRLLLQKWVSLESRPLRPHHRSLTCGVGLGLFCEL